MADEKENQDVITNTVIEDQGELKQALGNIQYIRDIMESSKDYFLSGYSGIAWGIVLIVGPILTSWLIRNGSNDNLSRNIWALWLIMGSICAIIEAFFFFKGAKNVGKDIYSKDFLGRHQNSWVK